MRLNDLTGSDYSHDYRALPKAVERQEIAAYCAATRAQFARIAKAFTDEANSRWILRHYLAMKHIINASVLSGSAEYCEARNLALGAPYFNYYALLTVCQAFVWTTPDAIPLGREAAQRKHDTILRLTENHLRRLSPATAAQWHGLLVTAKAQRELYSYRFPATGLDFLGDQRLESGRVTRLAQLLAELAVLNSECLDSALVRHGPANLGIPHIPDVDWATAFALGDAMKFDRYDRERLGKLMRAGWRATSLEVMASDGMVEDFYGAWSNPDIEDPAAFDPDGETGRLISFL